jgi:hypothetical protein
MRLEGKVSDLKMKGTCNSIFRSCYKWCSISHPRCSDNYLYVCDVCAQDYVCKDADIFHFKFNTTSWSRLFCNNADCLFFCKITEKPEMTSWHGCQDLLQTDVSMCIYNCYNKKKSAKMQLFNIGFHIPGPFVIRTQCDRSRNSRRVALVSLSAYPHTHIC